jgi:glucokinase
MALAAERAHAAGGPTVLFDVQEERARPGPPPGSSRSALARGDELVADLIDDACEALGTGIASAVNLLDVDSRRARRWARRPARRDVPLRVDAAARPQLFLQPPKVRLVAAALGDEGRGDRRRARGA